MTSRPITMEEFKNIVQAIMDGGYNFRPNPTIALLCQMQASCGLRINDCLRVRLKDIYKSEDNHYRIKVKEQKTGKWRDTIFYADLYFKLSEYCIEHGRKKDEPIFNLTSRAVSKYLKKVTEYLDLDGVGTHSFRKLYATEIFKNSDLLTVSMALMHSNINTTVRYLAKNPRLDSVLEECGSKLLNIEVTNK
ncbi:MAG: tyrosine-type recombinase/integrase [Oscillospiraceae bacterium]|nr:tyrosine-type recombinase/integrase [Oscillospiraceae bacterium]